MVYYVVYGMGTFQPAASNDSVIHALRCAWVHVQWNAIVPTHPTGRWMVGTIITIIHAKNNIAGLIIPF